MGSEDYSAFYKMGEITEQVFKRFPVKGHSCQVKFINLHRASHLESTLIGIFDEVISIFLKYNFQ